MGVPPFLRALFFLFVFYASPTIAQTLEVVVTDSVKKEIGPVIVSISSPTDSLTILEYFELNKGIGEIKLQQDYAAGLILNFTSFGFEKKSLIIRQPIGNTTYPVKVILKEKPPTQLDDIIVTAQKRPFKISNDTVSFNVSAYSDGSETKIQDVIKKLPGVSLNEQSGEIKYKGKSIETVTLDGDNLFGYNYTLGTKNINVDKVEEVEAIDNYTENPLLKGIEQGGKVSLNLKLKEGSLDVSGNGDFGGGWFSDGDPAYKIGANILGVTKTYKSFATIAHNNIGINHAPFDYFGFNFSLEQQNEKDYFANKIIPETRFSNILDAQRANINNQFFGNYNAIFRLSPKLSVKTNLYFLRDEISREERLETNYGISNSVFSTQDQNRLVKHPTQYRFDVELKHFTTARSLLVYNVKLRKEEINTQASVIQNNTQTLATVQNADDLYLKQSLLWTQKLAHQKALQINLFHASNDLTQSLGITPSVFTTSLEGDHQKVETRKTLFEGKATYLGASRGNKYAFTLGTNKNHTPFESQLLNASDTLSENRFNYDQSTIFNNFHYHFNLGKWRISPSYSIRFLKQGLEQPENDKQEKNNMILEPSLDLKLKLGRSSFGLAQIKYTQAANAEQYFFVNQILINNRTTLSNLPSLNLQKSLKYSLAYRKNNFYNQFQLNADISFQRVEGNLFSNQNITENTLQLTYFFSPQKTDQWHMNIEVSKYLSFIQSKLRLSSDYSILDFNNIVNLSDLRQNQNRLLSSTFFWKTAFDMPINFESTITFDYSYSKSQNQNAFLNRSWQKTFKIIAKPAKRWFLILQSDYYLPNMDQTDVRFLFLDATIRYKSKSKKWNANLKLRNMTNENNFEQIATSDIATTLFRSNLLPRYLMLDLSFSF